MKKVITILSLLLSLITFVGVSNSVKADMFSPANPASPTCPINPANPASPAQQAMHTADDDDDNETTHNDSNKKDDVDKPLNFIDIGTLAVAIITIFIVTHIIA